VDRTLRSALDFKLSEILRYDLVAGILGGSGAAWLALTAKPGAYDATIAIAAGLVGVVIGAVIAGVAVLGAFMDQEFLRKLRAINEDPAKYLAPFIFTALIGVAAGLCLLLLAALPKSVPDWAFGIVGGLGGFFTVWTLVSLAPALRLLVNFVGLKSDASAVPDQIVDPNNFTQLPSRRSG